MTMYVHVQTLVCAYLGLLQQHIMTHCTKLTVFCISTIHVFVFHVLGNVQDESLKLGKNDVAKTAPKFRNTMVSFYCYFIGL